MFTGFEREDLQPWNVDTALSLANEIANALEDHIGLDDLGIARHAGRRQEPGMGNHGVWDIFRLRSAFLHEEEFTVFPHVGFSLRPDAAAASVVVPHRDRGPFLEKMETMTLEAFRGELEAAQSALNGALSHREVTWTSVLYVVQRHYPHRKHPGIEDARLEIDLRTSWPTEDARIKYEPQWLAALHSILAARAITPARERPNIQFGFDVRFPYENDACGPELPDLIVDAWRGLRPFIDFVRSHPIRNSDAMVNRPSIQ